MRSRVARIGGLCFAGYLVASGAAVYSALAGSGPADPAEAAAIADRHSDVHFTSQDGLALSGWLFHAPAADGRSAILVHGWHGNRVDVNFIPLSRALLADGYDVLLFDMRGAGDTGGHQTFATQEPRDVVGAYMYMRDAGYAPAKMLVMGNSMGASSVIAATSDLRDVAAIVCDSPFANVGDAIGYGWSEITHLPAFVVWPALQMSRVAGVDPGLSLTDVVRAHPERAYLFLQAAHDPRVNPADGHTLVAASANPATRLEIFDGDGHLATYSADPTYYLTSIRDFAAAQMRTPPQPQKVSA